MAELQPDNPYAPQRRPDPQTSISLPPETMQRVEAILGRYPTRQAALLPVLHLAQETWGWLPPEGIVQIADLLDLSPAYVFGVVTFYNMYNQKKVGKYHLQVCTNLSCMVRGAYDLYGHLCEKLSVRPAHTTDDGLYTVIEVECLGSCGTAPVVQVNNDYHEEMTVEKMDHLLARLK